MSEYQCVMFQAVDRPVSDENMEFMESQSSRAEMSPWYFQCEYNYSAFRGDEREMLRKGYDIFMACSSYGQRNLLIRLPTGLPNPEAAQPYLRGCFKYEQDKTGPGGILCYEPDKEIDDDDHIDLDELDDIMDSMVALREEIMSGDLRPFYLLHLAETVESFNEYDGDDDDDDYSDYDDEDNEDDNQDLIEAPVPAGLSNLTSAQDELADLYELDPSLIKAAAKKSPKITKKNDTRAYYAQWVEKQPERVKNAWITDLLANTNSDSDADVKQTILAEFRKSGAMPDWPTVVVGRSISKLLDMAEKIDEAEEKKEAKQAAQERAKKLASYAADPHKVFQETKHLVRKASTDAYVEIASMLADVREALEGTDQEDLAELQALKLKNENPTKKILVSKLREKGFLPK